MLLDCLTNTLGSKVDDVVGDSAVGDGRHNARDEGRQDVSHLSSSQSTVGNQICWSE